MRTNRQVVWVAMLGLVVAGLVVIGPGVAQEKGKAVKPHPIPLGSVYVTSEQKGLKRVAVGHGNFDQKILEELCERSIKVGLSNVFLVRGANITDAVRATHAAFNLGDRADKPISADQSKKDKHIWIVAYFGVSGSEPEAWFVKGVERVGNRIRVSFAKQLAFTDDLQPYFAWAELGPLEGGIYTLELYETGDQEIKLTRTVHVNK